MPLQLLSTPAQLRDWSAMKHDSARRIALVPTMGALHAGHFSLVDRANRHADEVVVSIFVNPTQFGPDEDFARYPRDEEGDIALLEGKASAVYLPAPEAMYPQGFDTIIRVGKTGGDLCGAFRPGHFDGVATAVAKLFLQAMPDVAVFGEKDYQQLHIIRRMATDLDIPVEVMGAPIIREPDGLALSSRNRYLSAEARRRAPALYRILQETAADLKDGGPVTQALGKAKDALRTEGFEKIDYVELRDSESLEPTAALPARLLAAAYLGDTRLIDNLEVRK